jgi:endonuclease III
MAHNKILVDTHLARIAEVFHVFRGMNGTEKWLVNRR